MEYFFQLRLWEKLATERSGTYANVIALATNTSFIRISHYLQLGLLNYCGIR